MRNPFRRPEPEVRAITTLPWNYGDVLPLAGTTVSQEQALSLAPLFSAVRIIAQDLSTLPIKGYRRVDDKRIPMGSLPALFDTLVNEGKLVPWLFRLVTSLALRGNAYGLITARDGFGYPTAISWLSPADVSLDESTPGALSWRWRGRVIPTEDIVHIPWFCLPGQTLGLSPIGSFATTLNLGLSSQQYGATWFDNGGVPPGTFRNTEKALVDQEQAVSIRRRVTAAIRSGEPMVYGKDWEYTPISVNPEEAQFLLTFQNVANAVGGIYGVRPERIGGVSTSSLTYQTVEQNQLEYTTSTLRYWAEMLEGHFFGLLPQRQYVKFNLDALVRSDLKTRWEVHAIARALGVVTKDEIRALEDLEPLPNGEGQSYEPTTAPPAAPTPPAQGGTVTPMPMMKRKAQT